MFYHGPCNQCKPLFTCTQFVERQPGFVFQLQQLHPFKCCTLLHIGGNRIQTDLINKTRYDHLFQCMACAEQIRHSGATSLYQLLEQVTSFYMTGSHFFANNVSAIRGDLLTHADNHVLILLNGKPLRESYSGGINFAIYNAFPILALDRIEVIRGPGSVLYGSNAFSGVINLVTGSKNGPQAQLGLGHAGFGGVALALTTEQSAWRAQLAVQLNQQDGWRFGAVDNNGQYAEIDYGQQNSGIYASVVYNSWQLDALSLHSEQDFFGASTSWAGIVAPEQRQEKSQRHALTLSNQWQQSERLWLDSAVSIARMTFSHYNYDAYATERYIELNQHFKASDTLALQAGGALWWQRFGGCKSIIV